MVGDDDVGRVAPFAQRQRGPKAGFGANGLGLKVGHPGVHARCAAPAGAVGEQAHALPVFGLGLLHHHGRHAVALGDQSRRQKLELAGEVLVDEEDVHGRILTRQRGVAAWGRRMQPQQRKLGQPHEAAHTGLALGACRGQKLVDALGATALGTGEHAFYRFGRQE